MSNIINTGYEAFLCGLSSAFFAQVVKFCLFTLRAKRINFKIFTTTGGMPSSHSAGVMGLSTAVGIISGYDSMLFAIAFGYALIVMYDAAGLRRAAGKTAACLNKMMDDFYKHDLQAVGGKLKELLGHTPLEVFAGALFGIVYAYGFHLFLLNACIN